MTADVVARIRPRSRGPMWIALAVGAVTLALVVLLAASNSATNDLQQANSPLLGKPAPEIAGPAVDGGRARLSDYRGEWVLVNFFASWCIPCLQEQGQLVKFEESHVSSRDAVVFAVRFHDPYAAAIRSLMNKSGAHWPVVDAPGASVAWGVTGPPESFLVDPGGYVRFHAIGQIYADGLDSLLAQSRP